MTVNLHRSEFDHAKKLVNEGRVVLKNEFIRGLGSGNAESGIWGVDDEKDEDNKGRYNSEMLVRQPSTGAKCSRSAFSVTHRPAIREDQ
jgi:hypothetical protein